MKTRFGYLGFVLICYSYFAYIVPDSAFAGSANETARIWVPQPKDFGKVGLSEVIDGVNDLMDQYAGEAPMARIELSPTVFMRSSQNYHYKFGSMSILDMIKIICVVEGASPIFYRDAVELVDQKEASGVVGRYEGVVGERHAIRITNTGKCEIVCADIPHQSYVLSSGEWRRVLHTGEGKLVALDAGESMVVKYPDRGGGDRFILPYIINNSSILMDVVPETQREPGEMAIPVIRVILLTSQTKGSQ